MLIIRISGYVLLLFLCLSFSGTDTISFNGTNFKLTHSEDNDSVLILREYIPEGENQDDYSHKILLLYSTSELDLDHSVKTQIKDFAEMKKKEPNFKYSLTQDPDGQYFIFDYFKNRASDSILDYNILKYAMYQYKGHSGVYITQYKMRGYQNDIQSFYAYIKEHRMELIDLLKNSIIDL